MHWIIAPGTTAENAGAAINIGPRSLVRGGIAVIVDPTILNPDPGVAGRVAETESIGTEACHRSRMGKAVSAWCNCRLLGGYPIAHGLIGAVGMGAQILGIVPEPEARL